MYAQNHLQKVVRPSSTTIDGTAVILLNLDRVTCVYYNRAMHTNSLPL